MTYSPQLRALGPFWRILAVFVDAAGASSWDLAEVWNHPAVKTAMLVEGDRETGWNEDRTARQLRGWGATDQFGIYSAAGLTDREAQVASMYFDNRMTSREIAEKLDCKAITVRVHLFNARLKLRRLAA